MERTISGYHQDDLGDWVAELCCGHNQHLRHRPPFQVRFWVLDPVGRAEHEGSPIDCPLCDRSEMPDGLTPIGTSNVWDEVTMPAGLRNAHRVALGRWGLIKVDEGCLRYNAQTTPPMQVVLTTGMTQSIPPAVLHGVEPVGHVKFSIEWYATTIEGS